MHTGVVVDCGRLIDSPNPKDDDDWWLELYVMLSRATRLEDILLVRAPPSEFLSRGPPAWLRKQVDQFAKRAASCRQPAEKLVKDLGFDAYLRKE